MCFADSGLVRYESRSSLRPYLNAFRVLFRSNCCFNLLFNPADALAGLKNLMICSELYLLVLVSIIFRFYGLLGKMNGTAYGQKVSRVLQRGAGLEASSCFPRVRAGKPVSKLKKTSNALWTWWRMC